jgi:hypothetical protein
MRRAYARSLPPGHLLTPSDRHAARPASPRACQSIHDPKRWGQPRMLRSDAAPAKVTPLLELLYPAAGSSSGTNAWWSSSRSRTCTWVRSVPAHTRRTARRALPCRLTRRRVRRALARAGARDLLAASVPRNRQGHLVCPPPCSLRALHPSSPPALSARPVPQAAAARSARACAARPVTCHVGSRDQPRDRSRARWQVPARGLQDRHGGT